MKKLLFLIVIILLGYFFFASQSDKQHALSRVLPKVATPAETRSKTVPVTRGKPIKLRIPALAIDAEIEHVGMDEKGNMDIPKADMNVAWYELGYLPGQLGNTVIAGHLDTKTGSPAVFYKLGSLQKGDSIIVTTDNDETLTFHVTDKEIYRGDSFPLVEVFGSHEVSRLNLITCEGTYDRDRGGYSHRTVIYSELSK